MTYTLSTRFFQVCLPDYVRDHCNGDDELLIGVAVGPDTTYESILAAIRWEVERCDKIPDAVTADMIMAEIDSDALQASRVVGNLVASGVWDNFDENSEEPYEESESLAWFRLSWSQE